MEKRNTLNITLSVTGELGHKMEKHPYIKWSQIARTAIESKLKEIEFEQQILNKSKLTKKDVEEISSMIKKASLLEMKRK